MPALRAADPTRTIRIVSDEAALSRAAAEQVLALARRQVRARGRLSVALSGGSTAQPLYALLAREPYRTRIPWDRLHVFWGDERCVPADHPESNFRMAHDAMLSRVPIPPANVHRIPVERGDPEAVARAYERALRGWFSGDAAAAPSFDLVFLGLGADGHTASLFPRSDALRERSRWVVASSGGTPRCPRVTLTIPALNRARHLIWLIAGSPKAAAVRAVLEGPFAPDDLPAQHIRPAAAAPLWLLDRAAAARLRHKGGRA